MEFRLLGPLEVRRDGTVVAVGGAKQRALLAMLLLQANEVVSRDRLIDALWSDRALGTSGATLDHQVSRLRKALAPAEMISTRPGGYMLEVEHERIDAFRFERLLEDGRRANSARNPAGASAALEQALALWRGEALAEFAYQPFARLEAERLEELRLVANEELFDARLALGQHRILVPEIESWAAKHPLRERLHAQLMLALYRSGRQAEALRVYSDVRRRLVDELGLEPGPELQRLEQAILRQDASLDAVSSERRPRGRQRTFVAALALIATAAAAAVGVLVAQGGTQSADARPVSQRNSVSLLSEASGEVLDQAQVQAPVYSRFGLGALWNVSFSGVVSKVDAERGTVVGFVNAVPIPCGLAFTEGAVWVTDCTSPTVVRIDPSQVVVTKYVRLPVSPQQSWQASATGGVAAGSGSIWVGQGTDNPSRVYRVDPKNGHVQTTIVIPEGGAGALTFGHGAVWVAGGVKGRLSKIDPHTYAVTVPSPDFGEWMCCVAVGGGFVWAAVGGTIWKTSEDGKVVSSTKLAATVTDLRYADGAVWASVGDAGTVVRVDPTTDATRTYRVGHVVSGVDVRDGVLAVSVQSAGEDVTADLGGDVVNVALKSDTLDWNSTDPVGVQSWNTDQVQFHYATCAKLFNYPDAAGGTGRQLVPEVAAGWPKVTNAGRTYTFEIRSGFGFSPPSHEVVTAESFRHEIERLLSQPGPWSLQLLADVVGAKAFSLGRTAHVSGITAQGNTLVIRLLKPTGELPTRLARPPFCAVPAELATIPGGLPAPIPTAGPYYLSDRSRDVFVLKPNPNYHGSRPQELDAIVYRTGIDFGKAVAQVGQGKVDYVQDRDPSLAPNTTAARSAGPRFRLTANNSTDRLALNTSRPLFADPSMRRAVAYALDRTALARAMEDGVFRLPTTVLLPPNLWSSSDSTPIYSLRADLHNARMLVRGRRADLVLATGAPATGGVFDPSFVAAVRTQLAEIGLTVRVVPLRQDASPAQRAAVLANADMTRVETSQGDVDDAVGFLLRLPYMPDVAAQRLDAIGALPTPRRAAAAARLARRLQQEAVYLGIADSATPELVSARLGCVIDQPQYPGVDLAALCLRKTHR